MNKILVVVDMQNDFIDGSLGTKEAQAIVPMVIKKIEDFKRNEGWIFVTLDTHYDNYLETQEGKNLPVKHCIYGSNGWYLHNDVLDALRNTVYDIFEKNTFGSKDLARKLERVPLIDEIILVGLCTDICVISNALVIKAFLPEVKITVDASCCAGVTPESHKNAIEAMKMCQINVINE